MSRLKIGLCCVAGAADDVSTWSGTPASVVSALSLRDDVSSHPFPGLGGQAYRAANLFAGASWRATGRKVNWEVESSATKLFTRRLRDALQARPCDVVIAMGWLPNPAIALPTPVLYWGDATIAQRVGQSPHWSGLSRRTERRVEAYEGNSFRALHGVVMPSSWAVSDVLARYALEPAKVHQVPFGANIVDPGLRSRRVSGTGPIRLLSIGVKWHRKGFDRAVQAVDVLRERGVDAVLDVVGVDPPDSSWNRPHVTYHGFLSKERVRDRETLDRLYRAGDVFLLPSRNDPFPMVLAEAGSYALPIVTADVGGIPDRVRDGGLRLADGAEPPDYADAVMRVVEPAAYTVFSEGSRRDFERLSSWQASAEALVRLSREVVDAADRYSEERT